MKPRISKEEMRLELLAGGLNSRLIRKVVRIIIHLTFTAPYRSGIEVLVDRIIRLGVINRRPFLVKYLKVCFLYTLQFTAGTKYVRQAGDPIVSVDTDGLPRIIPKYLRAEINQTNLLERTWELAQAILSIFNLYRAIQLPGKLKLDTITGPFTGSSRTIDAQLIQIGIEKLIGRVPKIGITWEVYHSSAAGPNASISSLSIGGDLVAGGRQGGSFWRAGGGVCKHFSNRSIFLQFLAGNIIAALVSAPLWYGKERGMKRVPYRIGRLVEKLEAAGKVRVFAVVDGWTQSLLSPLHHGIYRLLKEIPIDGTFNQEGVVTRCRSIAERTRCAGSFDLSAATDRLPVDLQRQVIDLLVSPEMGESGMTLLTNRDGTHKSGDLRYTVGQPMGAISSGGMLALTHHLIVQIAAYQSGIKQRFEDYAVLGDDVVIFDGAVAGAYLSLMKTLGVEINLAKSVISPTGGFEFAKRFCHPDIDISPLGSRALVISSINPSGASVGIIDAAQKGCIDEDDGMRILVDMEEAKLLKPGRAVPLYEGLYGPGGIFSKAPRLTAGADRRLKHIRVIPQVVEARIVYLILERVDRKLSRFWSAMMQKDTIEDPMDLGDIKVSPRGLNILKWIHPISWGGSFRCQTIREGIIDFAHGRSLQLAPFEDAKDDFYGVRGGYTALKVIDTSKYDPTFATSRVEKIRILAMELGTEDYEIQREVEKWLKRMQGSVPPHARWS